MSTKQYITIALFVIIALLSFFLGRASQTKEIKYVKGDTIYDSIPYPEYVEKEVIKPKWLVKRDTLRDTIPGKPIIIIEKVDTAAILADWSTERNYAETLFDDKENGKCSVSFKVLYNKATNLKHSYTPVVKQVTKENKFVPFVSAGYNSLNYIEYGGGLFYNDIGIEVMGYNNLNNGKGFGVNLKYKF